MQVNSAMDPLTIIAGIEQFGLAADGSDLRDLKAALATVNAEPVAWRDWVTVAKSAGEHGIRYRTNAALEAFLSAIRSALVEGGECADCAGTGFTDKGGARLMLARTPCPTCNGTGRATPAPADERVVEALQHVEYICGLWEENQGTSSLTIAVRTLLAALKAQEGR